VISTRKARYTRRRGPRDDLLAEFSPPPATHGGRLRSALLRGWPGFAYCALLAAGYRETCARLVPGLEYPLLKVLVEIALVPPFLVLISALQSLDSHRVGRRGFKPASMKDPVGWKQIQGWRASADPEIPGESLIAVRSRRWWPPTIVATLPDGPLGQSIVDRFREHAPEDPGLVLIESRIGVTGFAPVAARLLLYLSTTLAGIAASYCYVRFFYREVIIWVPLALLCFVGPGSILGIYLSWRKYEWRIVFGYSLFLNLGTVGQFMWFALLFVSMPR
jgi:hypothetical protein